MSEPERSTPVDWSRESDSSGPVSINPVKKKPRTMEQILEEKVQTHKQYAASCMALRDEAIANSKHLLLKCDHLESEIAELTLRRSETVTMCDQLRIENDRLQSQVSNRDRHLMSLGYRILDNDPNICCELVSPEPTPPKPSSINSRIVSMLYQFVRAVESGDISGYRITRVNVVSDPEHGEESVEFINDAADAIIDKMEDPDSVGKDDWFESNTHF